MHEDLTEASGAAASRRQRGIFFTVNDGGHEPILYATDRTGANRGAWKVSGANNSDWESLALGPCAPTRGAGSSAAQCVYIGDTGDNPGLASTRAIYRVPEPMAVPRVKSTDGANGGGDADSPPTLPETPKAEKLTYKYPDGSLDVEAMYVAPDGTIFLLSKRENKDSDGRRRGALVFRLAADGWGAKEPPVAELVDSLPIVPGSAWGREITDASLAPNGKHVAVRTYTQLFIFAADPASGRILTAIPPAVCNLVPLKAGQGEGVTWSNSGELVLTSEGKGGQIHVVHCPLPARRR